MTSPQLEPHYRIGQAAKLLGMTTDGLRYHIRLGNVRAIKTPGGHWRIPESEVRRLLGHPIAEPNTCAIYARVSSQKQKAAGHLDRQVERLRAFADGLSLQITTVITDIASGLNENRKGLHRLLKLARERMIRSVVIEFRDRLTRFGYGYVTEYLALCGVKVFVKEEVTSTTHKPGKELNQELVEDLIAIINSFSGKLYGRRSAKFRKLTHCVKQSLSSEAG